MAGTLEPLVLDLVEWVAREPRTYAEAIDAWRTSCPRLTVWEDAVERGYLARQPAAGRELMVVVTELGRTFLSENERSLPAGAERDAKSFSLEMQGWPVSRVQRKARVGTRLRYCRRGEPAVRLTAWRC